jgi:hypothetical protein
LRAYLDRDLGTLMALAERYQGSGQDRYSRLIDSLLWKRNRLMVERMAPRLAERSSFIAIGACTWPASVACWRCSKASVIGCRGFTDLRPRSNDDP